jgi:hypothetical protein
LKLFLTTKDLQMAQTPIKNSGAAQAATILRIRDLDQVNDEGIGLSDVIALDQTSQTFKMSLLQFKDFLLDQLNPIGSTLYRIDTVTPTDLGYPGTWEATEAGITLGTAAADDSDIGAIVGANTHALTEAEGAPHTHADTLAAPAHTHSETRVNQIRTQGGNPSHSQGTLAVPKSGENSPALWTGGGQTTPVGIWVRNGTDTTGGASATALSGAITATPAATAHNIKSRSIQGKLWIRTL